VARSRRRCGDERRIKQFAGEIVELGASSPPGKLPPMSAVGRPCSSSLIPQKLPKNGWKERHIGVSI
jgi:hypothetical protein